MTDEITYGERWGANFKKLVHPTSPEKAKRAHDSRKLYAAAIGPPQSPWCVVTMNLELNYVGVTFLDQHVRSYLNYDFEERDDRLFLMTATERFYEGASDKVLKGNICRFSPDGKVVVKKTDVVQGFTDSGERWIDVSDNWEPIPEFGQYESITRKGRV
jgi:hypothetical protein